MHHLLHTAALRETWAINPAWLSSALTLAGSTAPQRRTKTPGVSAGVAVLPLFGPISQRGSIFDEIFGGTSTEAFGAAFTAAINSDRVGSIVIVVDSPGGTTSGVEELGDIIHAGSMIKPVVAIADSQAASAAYWLAAQTGKGNLIAAPSASVGSIGVFKMHADESQLLAKAGIKMTFMSVPQFKTEGNPFEPLTEAAIAHHTQQVHDTYAAFVEAVARGRGVSATKVRSSYGGGRSFHAQQAVDMGMVDRIATLPQVLDQITGGGGSRNLVNAATDMRLSRDLCAAWSSGTADQLCGLPGRKTRHERQRFLDQVTAGRWRPGNRELDAASRSDRMRVI